MRSANLFLKDVRAKRKKVELSKKLSKLNLIPFRSFKNKLADLKDFVYFVTFVTIVIKLNRAI